MINWRFEGSNDMINWTCLDMRIQLPHDTIKKLCKPSATSTWGIDFKHHNAGFSCFRIVQIGLNSSGNDKLLLANLEVYGVPTNPDVWAFSN